MKCLNMKISDVLFFLLNFITTYQEGKIFLTTTSVDELVNQFYCPQISKLIYDNNLANYTINCKPLSKKYSLMNIETVLQHACFIVNDMLNYICENKFNITSDLFKIDKYDSICPFNFTYLEQLNFTFRNKKVPSELTNVKYCSKVCSDLYSNKTQCILLSKLNHYLENITSPETEKIVVSPKINKPPAKSEQPKVPNYFMSADQEEKEKSLMSGTKEMINQEKLELNNKKPSESMMYPKQATKDAKKVEKLITTTSSKVEGKSLQVEASEGETKIAGNENHIEEVNEIKAKDDPVEEEQLINENDKTISDDSFSDKADLNLDSNGPKMENFEDKVDSSRKGKEIYSGEGFFQAEDSHFFFYFIMVSSVIVVGYLAFHNKNKILAYALEGSSGRRNRRRPNPARYRKLETNLEEAISSNTTNTAVTSVVY